MSRARIKSQILALISDEAMTLDQIHQHFPDLTKECVRTHLSQMTRAETVLRVPPPKIHTTWIAALPDDD